VLRSGPSGLDLVLPRSFGCCRGRIHAGTARFVAQLCQVLRAPVAVAQGAVGGFEAGPTRLRRWLVRVTSARIHSLLTRSARRRRAATARRPTTAGMAAGCSVLAYDDSGRDRGLFGAGVRGRAPGCRASPPAPLRLLAAVALSGAHAPGRPPRLAIVAPKCHGCGAVAVWSRRPALVCDVGAVVAWTTTASSCLRRHGGEVGEGRAGQTSLSQFGDSDSEGVLRPRACSPVDGLDGKGCCSGHGLATVVHGVQGL